MSPPWQLRPTGVSPSQEPTIARSDSGTSRAARPRRSSPSRACPSRFPGRIHFPTNRLRAISRVWNWPESMRSRISLQWARDAGLLVMRKSITSSSSGSKASAARDPRIRGRCPRSPRLHVPTAVMRLACRLRRQDMVCSRLAPAVRTLRHQEPPCGPAWRCPGQPELLHDRSPGYPTSSARDAAASAVTPSDNTSRDASPNPGGRTSVPARQGSLTHAAVHHGP
jgi:hypothetical protein